jgi:hypothetical protein
MRIKIDWDYTNGTVDLSMHVYFKAVLNKYPHPTPDPARVEHAPHMWNPLVYGAKTQYIEEAEDSASLSPKDSNRLQGLDGTLLYYARAVYPILIMPVNVLA